MRTLVLLILLCLSAPALAQEKKDFPFRADGGLTKAEGQIADGNYAGALDTLDLVQSRRPGDADAFTYAGYAWYKLGDLEKARENIDRALKVDPKHLGANKYRATLFIEAGDFPRAIEQMQALRFICGKGDCAELNALQADINAARAGKD